MESSVPAALVDALKRQKYHFVGKHSAVKRCRWFHETLVNNRPCYKQKFYGIKTHQCIQMTPATLYCTQQCLFCWRAQSGDIPISWNETKMPDWDLPEKIVEESINAQLRILSGYKGNPKTSRLKYFEASTPKHVAISLTGEPALYGPLGELIRLYHRKGFTTFLVSNGTVPSTLKELGEEPTQLYISVCAPDKKTYASVCRPQIPGAWESLAETLSLLSSYRSPTVIRMTLVSGLNMKKIKGYARLVEEANPTYIETKAYMHVGYSRLRLGFDGTPSHEDVRAFSESLSKETGYALVDESVESRVVLLSRLEKPLKAGSG